MTAIQIQQTAGELVPELARYQRPLIVAGAAGLVLAAAVSLFTAGGGSQFFQSYLMAYMFCLGITLGCLALGMVHQLSGGAWGVVLRRPIGAAARIMPVLTLLFLPILAGMQRLYAWTDADIVAADEAMRHRQLYLNVPFFIVRAAIYFVVWNGISYVLARWSREQDRTGDPRIARRMQRVSAGGLVAYGLTITFASFDWLMSLEPDWFSTIYGVLIIGGQGLSALAFLILVIAWLSRRPPLNAIISADHFHDVGNLTLAFVMLWAYFAFSQYLIIWSGNLPAEIAWYQHRLQTGWRAVALLLVLFHFAVPFVVLLSRTVKREPMMLARVAGAILVARLVDLFWLVAPGFHRGGVAVSWLDVELPVSLASLWLGCFIWQFRGRAILPVYDPEFDETLGPAVERVAERPANP
jgi:hypothetical protein